MVFSDKDIKEAINNGIIGIDPSLKDVQPASVDLHLDKNFLRLIILVYHSSI